MKKIIRLTESDLIRIVKKIIKEESLYNQPEPITDPNVNSGAGSKLNQALGNLLDSKQVELLNQGKAAISSDVEKTIFDKYYQGGQPVVGKYLILDGIYSTSKIIGPIKAAMRIYNKRDNGLAIWTNKTPIFNYAAVQRAYLDDVGSIINGGALGINNRYKLPTTSDIRLAGFNNLILPPYPTDGSIPRTGYFTSFGGNRPSHDYYIDFNKIISGVYFNVLDHTGKVIGIAPLAILNTQHTWEQTGIDIRIDNNLEKQIQLMLKDPKEKKKNPNADIFTGVQVNN
jgi:hypothetical protein